MLTDCSTFFAFAILSLYDSVSRPLPFWMFCGVHDLRIRWWRVIMDEVQLQGDQSASAYVLFCEDRDAS